MRTHTNAHPEKEKDGETRRDWEREILNDAYKV